MTFRLEMSRLMRNTNDSLLRASQNVAEPAWIAHLHCTLYIKYSQINNCNIISIRQEPNVGGQNVRKSWIVCTNSAQYTIVRTHTYKK